VSKVVYINILKSSALPLLKIFLANSGWNIIASWLATAVTSNNFPLCSKLLLLLAQCPSPPNEIKPSVLPCLSVLKEHHHLVGVVEQVLSHWSDIPISSLKYPVQLPSRGSISNLDQNSNSLDSPMTPSRRSNRPIIPPRPSPGQINTGNETTSAVMFVNYQESLELIEDKLKPKRRKAQADVEVHSWKRRGGRRKTTSRDGQNNLFLKLPTTGTSSDKNPTCDEKDMYGKVYRTAICRPKGLKGSSVIVVAVDDNEIANMSDTFASEDVTESKDGEEMKDPLQIFEDINRELKESLALEKHRAMNSKLKNLGMEVGSRERIIRGSNVFKCGVEGPTTAKEFKLARMEKFQEEKRMLEDEHEAQERRDRELSRERAKKAKEKAKRKAKELKEQDERLKKIEMENQEKLKREKIEAEFRKRREEERLKRQEKKRKECNLGSFKKSELNDLDNEDRQKIKLIAQQMKQGGSEASTTSSKVISQSGMKSNDGALTVGEVDSTSRKPKKPMFSTAKNKNKDLLASLSDAAVQQPKRAKLETKHPDILKKKDVPCKKVERVDYGTNIPTLEVLKVNEVKDKVSNDNQSIEIADDERVKGAKIDSENLHEISEIKSSVSITEVNGNETKNTAGDEVKVEKKRSQELKSMEGKNFETGAELKKLKKPDTKSRPLKLSLKEGVEGKSGVTLQPVSKLKESSMFASCLENLERTVKRRKKSSFEEYKSKRKSSESFKEGEGKEVDDRKNLLKQPAGPILPRRVSGILVIERGIVEQKKVSWREEEDLVQVEFFKVDTNERVNVHKLKFEEVRRQEREKDRKMLKEEIDRSQNVPKDDFDEEPLLGFTHLSQCGRTNFNPGAKSKEREIQRMREERVLPSIRFGALPVEPSEPDITSNESTDLVVTRTILCEDISGEATTVDYSAEGWPEPKGSSLRYEDGVGALQFYGVAETSPQHQEMVQQGPLLYPGRHGEIGQRFSRGAHNRGFGRGGAAMQQMGGFRGGLVDTTRGRREFIDGQHIVKGLVPSFSSTLSPTSSPGLTPSSNGLPATLLSRVRERLSSPSPPMVCWHSAHIMKEAKSGIDIPSVIYSWHLYHASMGFKEKAIGRLSDRFKEVKSLLVEELCDTVGRSGEGGGQLSFRFGCLAMENLSPEKVVLGKRKRDDELPLCTKQKIMRRLGVKPGGQEIFLRRERFGEVDMNFFDNVKYLSDKWRK